MNHMHWKPRGLYDAMYEKFYEARQDATGYDLGQGPAAKVPPPTVKDLNPLKWWSLDRPKRLAAIRRVRDQFLNEILRLSVKPEEATS